MKHLTEKNTGLVSSITMYAKVKSQSLIEHNFQKFTRVKFKTEKEFYTYQQTKKVN